MKTIVVGSGIIGASIAYHLAVRGAEVTVVTGDRPGGIATAASFAWINAAPGNSRPYFDFRLKAILDWHRLQRELDGSLEMNWNGSLWWEDDMEAVEERTWESTSWGYPMRVVSRAEAREQEPSFDSTLISRCTRQSKGVSHLFKRHDCCWIGQPRAVP